MAWVNNLLPVLHDGAWGRLFQLLYLSIECFVESLPWNIQLIAIAFTPSWQAEQRCSFLVLLLGLEGDARGRPSWGLPFQDLHVWFGLSSPFTKFHSAPFVLTSVTFPMMLKLIEPYYNAFGSVVKNLPAMEETWVQFLSQEDPLKKEMATHSSILTWRIP